MDALEILVAARFEADLRPWPGRLLDAAMWKAFALAPGAETLALLALWAEEGWVRALFRGPEGAILPVAAPLEDRGFAALSPNWPVANAFERAIADLWGYRAVGGADTRLLDHGLWPWSSPLATPPGSPQAEPDWVEFFPDTSSGQLAIGPAGGDCAPPVHWRLRLEEGRIAAVARRQGYAHKGQITLMRGKTARVAARFAARLAAEATVAHSLAFASAAEAALGVTIPPRALALRGVMAEIERIMTHLARLATLAALAGAPSTARRCEAALVGLRTACGEVFGHRLMMDRVIPGGLACDLEAEGLAHLISTLAQVESACAALSLPVATLAGRGKVEFRAGHGLTGCGFAARASGSHEDARLDPGYPPYADASPAGLDFAPCMISEGDALARAVMRLEESALAITLARVMLADLPAGPVGAPLPSGSGKGLGVAEGPEGEIWHFLAIEGGMIVAAFPCDPGWRVALVLETALLGADWDEFALIRASFGGAVSGMDL